MNNNSQKYLLAAGQIILAIVLIAIFLMGVGATYTALGFGDDSKSCEIHQDGRVITVTNCDPKVVGGSLQLGLNQR